MSGRCSRLCSSLPFSTPAELRQALPLGPPVPPLSRCLRPHPCVSQSTSPCALCPLFLSSRLPLAVSGWDMSVLGSPHLSLSFSLCLSMSLLVCISLSFHILLPVSVSFFVSISLFLSLSLYLFVSFRASLSVSAHFSLSSHVSVSHVYSAHFSCPTSFPKTRPQFLI